MSDDTSKAAGGKPNAPDANKPVLTTDSASNPDGPTPAANAPAGAAEGAHGIEVQTVRIKAKGSFHQGGVMIGKLCQPGDEFEVERGRAAELRANGLAEYADAEEEKKAEEADPTPDYEGTDPQVVMRRRGRVRV